MAYSATDKRRVYLACRPIFAGNNALLRKSKKIRELVKKHQSSLHQLRRDFTTEKVVDIIKTLLEANIFQSDVKAKIEFPELYLSSPTRDVQRAASENDAARSAAEALDEIASREGGENESDEEDKSAVLLLDEDGADNPSPTAQPINMISLYPAYFPYHSQHAILSKVQAVLEECCFEFTQKWMPAILEEHAWDCAAAVELTKWTKLFAKRSAHFPQHAFKVDGAPLNQILFATNRLRHTAVHRLPTTSRGVEELILSAMVLAETLQDPLRTSQLEEVHHEVHSKIKAMELNKNVLEDTLSQELRWIQRQREELDKREAEFAAKVVRDDGENKALVGSLLEESVKRIFDVEAMRVAGLLDHTEQVSDSEEIEGVAVAGDNVVHEAVEPLGGS